MTTTTTKKCYRCGGLYPTSDFFRSSSRPGGLEIWCRSCKREYHRQWSAAHREVNCAATKAYRATFAGRMLSKLKSWYRRYGFKTDKTMVELFGTSMPQLQNWLEYTWFLNYGTEYAGEEVDVDHIKPQLSATTDLEYERLQHYTNLQYLKPKDNRGMNPRKKS